MLVLLDIELQAGCDLATDPRYGERTIVSTRNGGRQVFKGEQIVDWVMDRIGEAQWETDNLYKITDVTRVTEPQ